MDYKTLHSSVARLSQLSDEDFQSLTSCVSKHALKKGEKVLNEGEICRSLYFIEKGYLRTYYNKEGIVINLDFTFEQSFTSNVESFKSKQSSKLIIEAGEHALVWIFNISKLSHQDKSNPRLINLFRRIAIDILLSSKEYNNRLKIHTPAERYHYI